LAGEAFAGPLAAALFLASAQGSAGFGGLTAGKGAEPVQWAHRRAQRLCPSSRRGAAAPKPASAARGCFGQLIPLEIFINGARIGDWVLLDVKGALHAPIDAFEEWRVIRRPEVPGVVFRGQIWYPLWSVPGYEARLNPANQSLDLKFSPNAFATTRLTQDYAQRPPVTRPLTSVFLNYDLSYTQSDFNHGELTTKDLGALTELGLSGSLGVLTSSQLGRNLKDDPTLGSREWIRLETTFNRDFPDESVSLRIGDSTTRPGIWGRALYFGGVQLARNFALSPGFVTQPIPSLTGQATAPSTVELHQRYAAPDFAGPLGPLHYRQLSAAHRHRPGATGGEGHPRARNHAGADVLHQHEPPAAGFERLERRSRRGAPELRRRERRLRRALRLGDVPLRDQQQPHVRDAGRSLRKDLRRRHRAHRRIAVPDARPGRSRGQPRRYQRHGGLYQLGAEYASLRNGFTARTEAVTSDFRRVGQIDSTPSYRRQTLLSYTYFTRQFGQIGLAYARSDSYTTAPIRSYSANYTITLAARASLTFSVTRVDTQDSLADANAVGVNIVLPLDSRITAAGSATRRTGGTDFHVGASKAIGAERGEGWRALAGRRGGENYAEGGGYYQGSYGLVSADVMGSGIQRHGARRSGD
jgi:outer membrane usher protein